MATKKILVDLDCSGDVTADSFVKDGGTSAQFLKADGSVDSNTYLTSASIGGFIDGSGSAGKLPKFTDSDTVEDSIVTEDSGKIGIGVASPKAKLHVNGAVIIGNDTATASADLAGALRYWDEQSGGTMTAYVDICMKHGCGYQWTNIVTNRTICI